MCGINGILAENIRYKTKILNLNEMLSHRGPDDEGYVLINTKTNSFKACSGNSSIHAIKEKYPSISQAKLNEYDLIFGHRRLSIIDLSEGGHGPMCDSSGKIWITYNGEIYNYIELRDELKSFGHAFRTESDTEVILNAYLQWGTDCLSKFNGMWGFSIWDGYKKILFLARDRFGVKPLYYINSPDLFAFSSEIKPLTVLQDEIKIDEKRIPFFLLQGNRLNSENTYLKGIKSLKPSNFIIYKDGIIKTHRYYDINNTGFSNKSEKELCNELNDLLHNSIRLRFRSDVPVGTCLSGGFDSSSIVSISSDLNHKGIQTFSAVWSDKACDESKYIDIVNNKYGCKPEKIEPKAEEFESVFNKLNYYQEIPSEGPGLIPQWYVMSKAKGKVKVLLDGQGGDEVFGGYFSTQSYLLSIIKDKDFKSLLSDFNKFSLYLNKKGLHSFSNWLFPKFYGKMLSKFKKENYGILNKDIMSKVELDSLHSDSEPPKKFKYYLNNLSYHFTTCLTIPTLLHYEDRSSMAFSIESRVPFLDYNIVEFGLNLKPHYLINKNEQRYLIRKALAERLPKEVASRKDKLGYPTPFAKWTKGILKEYIFDTLLKKDALILEYIDKTQLKANLDSHFSGEKDYNWHIWRYLSLENIMHMYKSLQIK